jgi:nucleotide-binding universal stress UspA family protein
LSVRARSIVVGYDGSEVAQRALDAAADLAGYGSKLTVVHVLPEGATGHENGLLERARERLVRRQIAARYLEPAGDAGRTLLETAESIGADLVVVGRRERNALRRLWLGSVSARVVRRAECDVLVVR